ncbi:restriction endonuclease subunit S [Chromohalobacter israelensis]|uniref:restriction endonuclease subunit S n=1 Tax=Chromohalobacter israelensis TaxID=141390 RepID=UPI00068E80C4|nr:restriction endonuclease subunit S [Chromohalobacter israelensis]MDF9433131.1 restriction endonuclease subunit S [Chromohalobacter israelensis]
MSFPKYPEYKDSGVEWLGEVPAHWESRRLKDGGRLVAGSAFPHENQEQKGLEFPFYKVGDLVLSSDGRTMGSPQHTISKREVLALRARIVPTGAVVWAKIGAALMLNRRRLVNVPCCIDNNMTAYIPDMERLSPLWAYYWTSQLDFTQFANPGAVPSLGEGYQKTLPLLLPPPQEQATIASFLDHETARIDCLVKEQQRLIELLKEKRQAVISHAVTKGLDPDVPMKDSGVEWLGEVPAHWEKLLLKRVANIKYGIGEPPAYLDSGVPLIRATNVNRGEVTQNGMVFVEPNDIPEKRILWLKEGDIVVVRSGAYTGDSAIIRKKNLPSIAGFDMVVTPASCFPGFLQYALLSQYLKDNQIDLARLRAAQPHLNAEELGACFLLIPTFEEQKTITTFLDAETSKVDSMIEVAKKSIAYLTERRSALVSAAVTGKIDVRGWQPPAVPSATTEATQTETV